LKKESRKEKEEKERREKELEEERQMQKKLVSTIMFHPSNSILWQTLE